MSFLTDWFHKLQSKQVGSDIAEIVDEIHDLAARIDAVLEMSPIKTQAMMSLDVVLKLIIAGTSVLDNPDTK